MLLYKIAAFLVNFLLHVPLLPEIPSSDFLSLYHRTVRSASLQPCSACSNAPQYAFNRNGNLRPSPPAAPCLLAPLP